MVKGKGHKGFTLIEMLVVIGIISVLIGASLTGFSKMMKTAEKTRAQELLSNAVTALTAVYEADGMWPKKIRETGGGDGYLDKDVALLLAKRGFISLSMDADKTKLVGKDRFGIVTPWAEKVIKSKGSSATESSAVTGKATIQDHILRFAVDLDGDGIIERAGDSGEKVRATAVAWCHGKDGKIITSWTKGQTQGIE